MNKFLSRMALAFVLPVLAFALNACGRENPLGLGASWEEELLLHDGTVVIAERSQSYGGYPTLESQEREVLEEEWVFQAPESGQKIRWKVDFRRPPNGSQLTLLMLDFRGKTPYIATVPAGCIAYNHWGRPNPPYVFFRFDGKEWQRIPLAEFPEEFKKANVVVGGRSKPEKQRWKTLSVDKVEKENRSLKFQQPHLLQIVREVITEGDGNWRCPEMEYDGKGGWRSPGGAKAPHPIVRQSPAASDQK